MGDSAKRWTRWAIGAAALVAAFSIGARAAKGVGGVGAIWLGVLLIVVAAVCVFPEVMSALAAPITRWIDSLYLPGGRPEPPPLSYRLVRYYQLTQQWDLAVAEYQRILRDYPGEAEAYAGMVGLLVDEINDRRAARRWLKRGLRRVASRAGRLELREKFGFLLEGLDHRISA